MKKKREDIRRRALSLRLLLIYSLFFFIFFRERERRKREILKETFYNEASKSLVLDTLSFDDRSKLSSFSLMALNA